MRDYKVEVNATTATGETTLETIIVNAINDYMAETIAGSILRREYGYEDTDAQSSAEVTEITDLVDSNGLVIKENDEIIATKSKDGLTCLQSNFVSTRVQVTNILSGQQEALLLTVDTLGNREHWTATFKQMQKQTVKRA